ncbi:hypothetical protein SUBVAR_07295 [Subdoligranulum variabile DSM 15176]|uniref:Uncharacterized protein n=1 Tax=Subdoligranulum variabile DSM 15176 TaxID=411471 RepID=D1PSB3_9FIRM|nr:hypothetical protein SUBVAR_07295 [Subdoligranulum variabile DSM 15176]
MHKKFSTHSALLPICNDYTEKRPLKCREKSFFTAQKLKRICIFRREEAAGTGRGCFSGAAPAPESGFRLLKGKGRHLAIFFKFLYIVYKNCGANVGGSDTCQAADFHLY